VAPGRRPGGRPQTFCAYSSAAVSTVSPGRRSGRLFRQALHDHVLPSGTAVLTVAHRFATARLADHVVLVADGRVGSAAREC
jgi:hypothetical protein